MLNKISRQEFTLDIKKDIQKVFELLQVPTPDIIKINLAAMAIIQAEKNFIALQREEQLNNARKLIAEEVAKYSYPDRVEIHTTQETANELWDVIIQDGDLVHVIVSEPDEYGVGTCRAVKIKIDDSMEYGKARIVAV